jgi:excisionase family DNA binding protein
MFDLGRKLGPDSSSLSCPFMCPWCQLLLRTHFGEEVEENVQSGGTDKDGRLLLTIEEAAQRLGLGRSKTYQLAATGVLPVIHLGRSVRVPVEALQEWVRAQATSLGSGLGRYIERLPPGGAAIGRHAARSRRRGEPRGPIGRDPEVERRSQ